MQQSINKLMQLGYNIGSHRFQKLKPQQQFIMFHDDRLPNIKIRVILGGKDVWRQMDVEINQAGQINLNELVALIKQAYQLEPPTLLFYLDHSHGAYQFINQDQLLNIHFTSLICENKITFKCEPKLSDELLANPPTLEEETRSKRSRQRILEEAYLLVQQWRYFYRQGCLNQEGEMMKINLDISAEMVGIPRKTLEDYYLLFRLGKSLEFNFKTSRKERMGVLRSYVRERSKIKNTNNNKQIDEKKFFRELRFELLGNKPQYELFDILQSNRSHSSSDQDMIFQH